MDPPPPFDHPHHRRGHHHYADLHQPFAGGSGGGGGGAAAAASARSRYDYGSYEPHPLPPQYHLPTSSSSSDHHHHHYSSSGSHHPRVHHHQTLPPPPPLPTPPPHRHDAPHYAPPLRAPPDAYSPPPPPPYHFHNHQRHGEVDFRTADEIRRVASHHHHYLPPQMQQQQLQQLPWEEAEEERRHYPAAHQLRLSPSGSRKRQRCAMHDCGDLESTSSSGHSGPPHRRPRQQPHPHSSYAPEDGFVDRAAGHPGYTSKESFSIHSDSKGSRKMQIPTQKPLPGSPHAKGAPYQRRTPKKSAPSRVSVWQRIEENPVVYAPSSPQQLPKEVHISPCKSNNSGPALKELASVISVDNKRKSADYNDGDSNTGIKKNPVKKNTKVLASVLVKPSVEQKEKDVAVKKVTRKPDKIQKKDVDSTSKSLGLTSRPVAGVKKVKKIVIKKIVRKINDKDKEVSRPIDSEKRQIIDVSANDCEKEEGEITTSSFEKDVTSTQDSVGISDTAGVRNVVDVQKDQNNILTNPSGRNDASAIGSAESLNPTSVSGSEHSQKEEGRSSMNLIDNATAVSIESSIALDTSGSKHPEKEDDSSVGSGVKNAAFVHGSGNPQAEEAKKILSLSGEMNAGVASNSVILSDTWKLPGCEGSRMEKRKAPKDVSENNVVYMDGVTANHDTTEVSGNGGARREDRSILIGRNEENAFLINNFIGTPRTTELHVSTGEDAEGKNGIVSTGSSEKTIAFLVDSMGTPRTTEVGVSKDAQNEDGNTLILPSEKDFLSVNSWGTLNNMEDNGNEEINEKEGKLPMKLSMANTSSGNEDMQVKEGRMPVESSEANTNSRNGDIQDKEGRMLMDSSETNTSIVHHVSASNTRDVSVDESARKKERHMPTKLFEANTLEIIDHIEAPSTSEIITRMSLGLGREVTEKPTRSNERHAGAMDNTANAVEFDVAGGTEDNRMDGLVNSKTVFNKTAAPLGAEDTEFFGLSSSRNVKDAYVSPLYNPLEDSTTNDTSNIGVGTNATSKAAELMDLHRTHMSPENKLSLVHSRESSPVSGNSEQSVPTALTLGSNIYFSSAETDDRPEENHELVEGQQDLDVATARKFDSLDRIEVVTSDGLIRTGIQNWLTLPPAVSHIEMSEQFLNNGATVSKDRLGLDQSMVDGIFITQDHDITQDLDHHGSDEALFCQDRSIMLCGSNLPQSHLSPPKESSENVDNLNEIVLAGSHPTSSVIVLGHRGYQMVDINVDDPNIPIPSGLESSDAMDVDQVSSHARDLDHTNHSNNENSVVESNIKKDLLSSWIEAIASEAKKDHQPCKSSVPADGLPEKLLAPKESSMKVVLGSSLNSAVKTQMNFTNSVPPKVAPKQVTLPSSSREPTRSNQNARHKTWHRGTSNSSLHASQPSGLPPKLPLKKNATTQNSYIRKGNALIRNPSSENHPHSSSNLDAQNKFNKPVVRRSMNFVRKVDSNDRLANSNISVERPKTPPLPLHTKSISSTANLLETLSHTLQKQHGPETEKDDSIGHSNSGVESQSIRSAQRSEPSDANKVVYVRPKSNQLVAAHRPHPGDLVNSSMDKGPLLQAHTTSDLYFKKRKNQIVLSSSTPCDGQNTKDMSPAESSNSAENKDIDMMTASSNHGITGVKDRPHKAPQTINSAGCFSHVWTLNGQQPQKKGFVGTSHMKAFPRILPWKRKIFCKNFTNSHTSSSNMSSARIVRKLLQTRKRDMIYTVSTNGFSLRKSGVISVGGSSLKWSRSLEKRSQVVNKEATLAVAEVERRKREKRKRQSLYDKGRNDGYSESAVGNQLRNNNQVSSGVGKSSTCNEYVRVSKGNQLVRNPKNVIRMLASDKVRWSLHTVRSRLAKKQPYCQFFTRFGECKKPAGKCPYIHDRAKVAICTKFLKGLCSNASCKLTHQVLPERMQDCSYFLRGLCTNTACPYRHVKVNLNAPVCDDFLKGYCPDGDECHKKHSYACPVFEATGECPQGSRCKLHHPKNKIKSKRSKPDFLRNSFWGRYFDTSIGHDSETRKVPAGNEREKHQHTFSGGDCDFISLGADSDEGVADLEASGDMQLMELDSGDISAQTDNLDALIKPLRIMRTARV